jgi:hypothetical protein
MKGTKKVTCTVKSQQSSSAKRLLHWQLRRSGHAVTHGQMRRGRVDLRLDGLAEGRYRLHIEGQKGSSLIVVS